MDRRSLKFRIVALSVIWIALTLLGTALVLQRYYRDHISGHYDAHVFLHLEEMVAASSLTADGTLVLDSNPSDPRFDVPRSGWYWEIRHRGRVLGKSSSLGAATLDLNGLRTGETPSVHEVSGPGGELLRAQTLELEVGPRGERLLLVATAPMMSITEDTTEIARHMTVSFVVLGAGLLLAVVLQVRIALSPLRAIGDGIGDVRAGRQDRLASDFPEDVQPLVDELNILLEHNATLLKRARNQLGDLAHSVKNPLTVIANEARALPPHQRRLIMEQASHITSSVNRYLSRARASGSENVLGARSPVAPVAEDLVFAMQRIHQDRRIDIGTEGLDGCWFRGEAQDLEEMLGNLLDNACKWARQRVRVSCSTRSKRCLLLVEDDGPGIPEDRIATVLRRGERLDDTKKGHGLGLGIVQDIAALYGAKLTLGRSALGGLAAELDLPAA